MLGLLAAGSVIASEIPRLAAWPLALAAAAHGAFLARRELHRPSCSLVIPMGDAPATVDGESMNDLMVQWRGPLAFLHWRDPDGRPRRMHGWPDSLPAPARRELRLALIARTAAPPAVSMAP
jgi:toxin CptA